MMDEEFLSRVHNIRDTLIAELEKDEEVASEGYTSDAKTHMRRVLSKLRRLVPYQRKEAEAARRAKLKRVLAEEIEVEEGQVAKAIAQLVKNDDEETQEEFLGFLDRALEHWKQLAEAEDELAA